MTAADLLPAPTGKPISFLPIADMDDLPGIEWLIDGVLPTQAIVTLYGEPAHGKSFLAIDFALHVASGLPWTGRDVRQGPVIYVVAEGSRGMKNRMQAWRLKHPGADVSTAFVVLEPVMLHDRTALQRFTNGLDQLVTRLPGPPALIVLDTLAQNFVGGEENSVKDMGIWLHGARTLQERFKASVLVVHHAARGSDRERGSTALRGASDTMVLMKRKSEKVNAYTMICKKQKDAECFPDVTFQMTPVFGSHSIVLEPVASEPLTMQEAGPRLVKQPVDDPLEERVKAIAAEVPSLSEATARLMEEFPELTQPAAKSRLARMKAKMKAKGVELPTFNPDDPLSQIPDGSLL